LILQNKVDLVREAEALEQQKAIAKFIEGGCQDRSIICNGT
jgi:translation initiation factor 2 gamma subunit (eIF-2gamma)